MIPKHIIKLAIEGGWGGGLKPNVIIEMLPQKCIGFHYPGQDNGVSMSQYDLICQPQFWQALGKAKGWKGMVCEWCGQEDLERCDCYTNNLIEDWRCKARGLFDLFMTNGDTKGFWDNLK